MKKQNLRGQMGITLIELMVVMALIVLLASLLLRSSGRLARESATRACIAQMQRIAAALDEYCQDTGDHVPNTWYDTGPDGSMNWLIPKYLSEKDLIDPWGKRILFSKHAGMGGGPDIHDLGESSSAGVPQRYTLNSYGPDRRVGGNDDISYPTLQF